MKFIYFFLAAASLVASACGSKTEMSFAEKIELTDMNDEPIDLQQFRGKTVFINVWATWCKPCIEEMPSIKEAQNILKGKNIEFLLASNEDKERIKSFAVKRQLELNYVQLENLEELQIPVLPVTYILNSEGEVVFSEVGYRKWDDPINIEVITKIIENRE